MIFIFEHIVSLIDSFLVLEFIVFVSGVSMQLTVVIMMITNTIIKVSDWVSMYNYSRNADFYGIF